VDDARPAPNPYRPVDILALTGIRSVAAGWVVLKHITGPLFGLLPALEPVRPVAEGGHLGVEVFFVLSGFIISHNYAERFRWFDCGTYRGYLGARVARIYPVHAVALLGIVAIVAIATAAGISLITEAPHTPWNMTANLLMLHSFPGAGPINGPSWSVACEMGAYMVFPLLALLVVRVSRSVALAGAAAVLGVGVAVVMLMVGPHGFHGLTFPVIWARIAVCFTAGCLLWAAWKYGVRPSWRWDATAMGAAIGAAAVLMLVPSNSATVYLATPLIAVFVAASASASGTFGQLLSSTVMRWGGRVSYSLYMTHFTVLMVLHKLVGWETFQDAPLAARLAVLAGYMAVIVCVAATMYYVVEEPGRRLVRRWLTSRRNLPQVPVVSS
jgi:peptidoglycan/LPS O-acetylase OafA/YrhL